MKQFFRELAVEDSGQDIIEYALVAGLIALGLIVATKGLTNKIGGVFNTVGTTLTNSV